MMVAGARNQRDPAIVRVAVYPSRGGDIANSCFGVVSEEGPVV